MSKPKKTRTPKTTKPAKPARAFFQGDRYATGTWSLVHGFMWEDTAHSLEAAAALAAKQAAEEKECGYSDGTICVVEVVDGKWEDLGGESQPVRVTTVLRIEVVEVPTEYQDEDEDEDEVQGLSACVP